jgi:hypothetical protein
MDAWAKLRPTSTMTKKSVSSFRHLTRITSKFKF